MKKLSLIVALIMSSFIYAQEDFEGTITYDLTYEDLMEQVKAMESMLPKSSTVYVKDGISKAVTPNGMGGETIVLSDSESGDVITLTDMMGNKIAIKSNTNEAQEDAKPTIEYVDEEKEIIGYKCKKAIISSDKNDVEVEVFYTEELPAIQVNAMSNGIKGMPMQIRLEIEPYTLIQTVKSIEKGKVKKIKMVIPSDYQEMTQEELQQSMGGGM